MATIYTATVKAWDEKAAAEKVFYFATAPWISAAGDTPAATFYEPRISQPALLKRDAFSTRTTYGQAAASVGELELRNNDAQLDPLDDYEWDGRDVTLKVGSIRQVGSPTWTTVFVGKVEQLLFTTQAVTLRLRTRDLEMKAPARTSTYAGNNAPPNGVEGGDDLKGKLKPLLVGYARAIAAPCVNVDKLIYQFSDWNDTTPHATFTVLGVYDGATAIAHDTVDSSSVSDMQTNAPAAGKYRAYKGYVRLGTAPSGTVNVDAKAAGKFNAGSYETPGGLIATVAQYFGGIAVADVTSADITALDSAAPYACGTWIAHAEAISAGGIIDRLAQSVGAYWGFDAAAKLRMGKLSFPAARWPRPPADAALAPPIANSAYYVNIEYTANGSVWNWWSGVFPGSFYTNDRVRCVFRIASPVSATKIRISLNSQSDAKRLYCSVVELEAYNGGDGVGPNYAAASQGSTASATRTRSGSYAASSAIDGDCTGQHWGSNGGWSDAFTPGTGTLTIDFGMTRTIDTIVLYQLQPGWNVAPALTIDQSNLISIERVPSRDSAAAIPVYRCTLSCSPQYASVSRTLVQAVAVEDTSIRTAHPLAGVLAQDSYLDVAADATAEATNRLALYGRRRDTYEVTIALAEGAPLAVTLSDCVLLSVYRYRLDVDGGRLMWVIGILPDIRRRRVTLTLWG